MLLWDVTRPAKVRHASGPRVEVIGQEEWARALTTAAAAMMVSRSVAKPQVTGGGRTLHAPS
jgi:hypothetical protein